MIQLYEKSEWSFRQKHVGLKAHGDGAVEVELEGEALRKGESEEGSLLLPIALTRELPPYYRIAAGSAPETVELLAYQAKDGLWCIAAQVRLSPRPQPSPPSSIPPSDVEPTPIPSASPSEFVNPPAEPTQVKLRVQIVSPEFSTTLPLLIPTGQSRAPVDTTVSLPLNARFGALEVGSDKQEQLTSLTVLPPTVSGSEVVAAARLTPGEATTWDFSRLTYSTSTSEFQRSFHLSPTALLVSTISIALAMLCLIWLRKEQELKRAAQLSEVWRTWRQESSELRRDIEHKFERTPALLDKARLLENQFYKDRPKSYGDRSDSYGDRPEFHLYHTFRPYYEMERELETGSRILDDLRDSLDAQFREGAKEEYYASIKHIEERADLLQHSNERFKHTVALLSIRSRFLFYLVALMALSIFAFLLATLVARGQTTQLGKQAKAPIRFAVLGDLGLGVKPEAAGSDRVGLTLNFFPVASAPTKEGKEEVTIALGDNNNQELETITGTPEKSVDITQRSRKKATLSMKVNAMKPSELLSALSNPYVASVNPGKEFSEVLNNGNLIGLECLIRNGQTFADHNASRSVNWFPWETVSVQIPMELSQPAYLSKINIQRPSTDYVGNVIVDGLIGPYNQKGERSFVESGQDYQLNVGVQDSRVSIPANRHFVLKADFQRTAWQRFFLTWGQLVIALVIGAVLGIIAGRFRNTRTEFIVGGLGVLGLPFVIRASVFSTYTTLPAVATGQGITVFEIFFFVSFVIYAGAAIACALISKK
ncbi:MAG TPA: hypothetical protein VLL54_14155 [Pyrinomonadaceae bacterium]|nr:hypothetical protein [Pyrinomonadaceae bacterium]